MNGWIFAMWSPISSWLMKTISHPPHLWISQQWIAQSSFLQSWQEPPLFASGENSSLLVSKRGEAAREAEELDVRVFSGVVWLLESACFILLCCLSPFSETDLKSHWSQEGTLEAAPTSSTWFTVEWFSLCFKYSSFRLAFLLRVEGLAFFLTSGLAAFFLVSREKENPEVMVKEKLKAWPWLASAWQKSMHLEAREVSTSTTAVILALLLK